MRNHFSTSIRRLRPFVQHSSVGRRHEGLHPWSVRVPQVPKSTLTAKGLNSRPGKGWWCIGLKSGIRMVGGFAFEEPQLEPVIELGVEALLQIELVDTRAAEFAAVVVVDVQFKLIRVGRPLCRTEGLAARGLFALRTARLVLAGVFGAGIERSPVNRSDDQPDTGGIGTRYFPAKTSPKRSSIS